MSEVVIESIDHLDTRLEDGGPTIIMFTQPATCVPCRQVKPHISKFAEKHPEVSVLIVDLDIVPDAMVDYKLMSVPTLMLYRGGMYSKHLSARTVLALEKELA